MKRPLRSYGSLLGLVVALPALGSATGCAARTPPPAVVEAETALDHTSPATAAARPGLVAEGKELLAKAKELAARGEDEKATLVARQSIQKFRTAHALAEREQGETFLSALEKSRREGKSPAKSEPERAAPEPSRTPERGPTVVVVPGRETREIRETRETRSDVVAPVRVAEPARAPEPARDGSLRSLAERKIVELSFKKSEALGQAKDQTCGTVYREYESILELAQKRFDAQDYERAYEFALRAEERFRACDAKTSIVLAQGKAAETDAAQKKAAAAVQKAQIELSRAEAVASDDPATLQGKALVSGALGWFEKKSFAEAEDLAGRAFSVLVRVQPKPKKADAPSAEPKRAEVPETKTAACDDAKTQLDEAKATAKSLANEKLPEPDKKARAEALAAIVTAEKKLKERACEPALVAASTARTELSRLVEANAKGKKPALASARPWEAALTAIQEAERARGLAKTRVTTDADRTVLARGEEALSKATSAYEKDDLPLAEQSAKDARNFFDGIREKPSEKVADKKPEGAPEAKPEPRKDAPAPVSKADAADEVAEKRVATYAGQAPTDPAWKTAYSRVYRALALRDEAEKVSPQDRAKLAQADQSLTMARVDWQSKRYAEARAKAESVITLLGPLVEAGADSGSAEELEASRARGDAALREAGQLATVCKKERCVDRDVKRLAQAKELLESARRAYDAKRFRATVELAERAGKAFDEVLHVALPPSGPTDAEKEKAMRGEAEDALRDATVAEKLCATKGCRERDPEGTLRARETLLSAQVACNDKRFEPCRDRARAAEKAYRATIAAAPTFEVPAGLRGIARQGDALLLDPPIVFTNGTSSLDPKSDAQVGALAKTLVDNRKALKKVNLVGYTDNRGYAPANKKLSADRAARLRAALVSKGVPADLLVSEGRGSDSPVDDNATERGRERNRRVEVRLELEDGAK